MAGAGGDGVAAITVGIVPSIKALDEKVGFPEAGFAVSSVFLAAELVQRLKPGRDGVADVDEVARLRCVDLDFDLNEIAGYDFRAFFEWKRSYAFADEIVVALDLEAVR